MLYIIVPVYNRIETTQKFIASLYAQEYSDFKLIVVDDGSTDGTSEILMEKYPKVIVLKGNGHLFWGGGINMGLEYVKLHATDSDYVAFANNDILLQHDTILNLMNYAVQEPALFHSLSINSENCAISSGAKLVNWVFFKTIHPFRGCLLTQIENVDKVEINLMTARFVVFPFNILYLVGNIDTAHFPHYVGDNDFSMSFYKLGIKTYVVPTSRCIVNTDTTGDNPHKLISIRKTLKSFFSIRSTNNLKYRYRFGRKHCPTLLFPLYLASMLGQVVILNIFKSKR